MNCEKLDADEVARYSRHILLPQIGLEGQQKLKNSKVLVIGMGGLGSPATLYLAAAGIGTLGLADFDSVTTHNLQRQIIHSTKTVNQAKIDSAESRIKELNPHCKVIKHSEGITIDNALELLQHYDIVVDGSDNFPTRYLVSDAAWFARKPLVYGSIYQFEGQVSLFHPASHGPSYRCLFPKMPEPGSVPNCEEAGVFGALCGVIGSFQALETIKFITGCGETLIGKLLTIDSLSMRIRTINIKRDPNCPLIGENPTITKLSSENYQWSCSSHDANPSISEISVSEASVLLSSKNRPFLLDVREADEVEICKIEGATNIPVKNVPHHFDNLPKDKPILVYCHHGMRSLKVAHMLAERGFHVSSMSGGIDSWAKKIDPNMKRY
jgi:sulfur-carrier protein adenylyltransferase/sulfurtransferase